MRVKTLSEVKFDEETTVAEGQVIDVQDEKTVKSLINAGAVESVDTEETQQPNEPTSDDLDV